MNKFLITLIFLAVLFPPAYAQNSITISGRVVNKAGSSLIQASISLINSPIGTITNESGEFIFFIPEQLMHDTLLISHIGYKPSKKSVLSIKSPEIFTLEESVVILNDVTVTGDEAKQMVQKALQSIDQLYRSTPYLMEGFHRSWEKVQFADSTYCPGTLVESAVTIADPGYSRSKSNRNMSEQIYVNEIRRSALMEGWNYGNGNSLNDLLSKNLVKYPLTNGFLFLPSFLQFPNSLLYEFDGESTIDGEPINIIKIEIPNDQNFPAYYRVYMSESDYAILRVELHGQKKNIEYNRGVWHTEELELIYSFKRFRGIPYLNYIKKRYTIKNLDLVNRKVVRTEFYFRELMINQIILDDVGNRVKNLEGFKSKNISLAAQAKNYNDTFWKQYNVIKDNPLDKTIVDFFEKARPCQDSKKHRNKK